MPSLSFPAITAATAGALGIWHVLLTINVSMGRVKFKTGMGDGGNEALSRRIRMHGNLTENAPLFLILLGLAELSGTWPHLVMVLGPLAVVLRLCHAYGLSMNFGPGPNPFRAIGAVGTMLSIVVLAVACLTAAVPHFR